MSTITPALAAHYAGGSTTLATCWRVTLQNGTVYGFTSIDQDLEIDGIVYSASSGVTPSAMVATNTLAVDNLEVQSILSADFVTEEDLNAGLWDYAEVHIFEVNYRDLSQGELRQVRGRLGEITARRNDFVAELRGLTDAYTRMIGELYGPACREQLGSPKCGIDLSLHAVSGTIGSMSADGRVIGDSARTEAGAAGGKAISGVSRAAAAVVTCSAHGFRSGQLILITGVQGVTQQDFQGINGRNYIITVVDADHFTIPVDTRTYAGAAASGPTDETKVYSAYLGGGTATAAGNVGRFTGGLMTMTSGANAGLSMEVGAYAPGSMTLRLSFPYPLEVGDTYTMTPGCGKRFIEDCVGTWQNGDNFRGEPFLPGTDQILIFGGQQPGEGGS